MSEPRPTTRVFIWNYVALMILLAMTALLSKAEIPIYKGAISLLIAAIKLALVFLFFMQLRYQRGLVRIFAATGFFWLAIIGTLTFCDYVTRGWLLP